MRGLYITLLILLLPACLQRSSRQDLDSSQVVTEGSSTRQGDMVFDSSLVGTFNKLMQEANDLQRTLPAIRDRRGKLRLALIDNLGLGCIQQVPLRDISVVIQGDKVAPKKVDKNGVDSGTSLFLFSFSDILASAEIRRQNDELRQAIFRTDGEKIWQISEDFKIGQLQRISITKVEPSIRSKDEVNRVRLLELKLYVNGALIYSKAINHVFTHFPDKVPPAGESQGPVWSAELGLNEAYLRANQRDDCSSIL